jgi:glutamyl-tRNA(Gln) amidotransferase subunit E
VKAGLEVHQQLATGKLFCACPSELSEVVGPTVLRRLRATGGENHAVDAAAAFQAGRGFAYRYEATPTSCLVELDEEPPHAINPDAVDVALTMALLFEARPLDEIEVMRKIVVDGSNTAGFQRTALVAVDGHLTLGDKRISIASICLEEDAARKVGESDGAVTYRLDRLGIPLIEIATGPEITDGHEARAVAEEIGALLRSTGRVRRGIGTIREDLNVSTPGGARVEIKGVQELRLIHEYAAGEEERQRVLIATARELRERGASVPDGAPIDVGALLRPGAESPIARTLARGGVALAFGLPGFGGQLAGAAGQRERLGRELAEQARAAGLGGLLHSDELPAQGIDAAQAAAVRTALGLAGPNDAFVLLAAPSLDVAHRAAALVRARARAALDGVPAETRDPLPDGRTRYSRPLPGRDRMYPETDVPPVPISPALLATIRARLPERPEATRARLMKEHGLSEPVARQIQRAGDAPRFFALVEGGHAAASVARLLTQEIPQMENESPSAIALADATLDALLGAVERGSFSKEGIGPVLRELGRGATLEEAAARAGLSGLPAEELRRMAEDLVEREAELLRTRGDAAFQPLMGDLMRSVRGRVDGRLVAEALRAALARSRGRGSP